MYSWLLLQKISLFVIDVIVSSGCYIARLECDLHVCSSNQGEWLAEVNCSDLKNKRRGLWASIATSAVWSYKISIDSNVIAFLFNVIFFQHIWHF